MQAGQTFVLDLDTHIAARNHNTVGAVEDFIEVFNALNVFNLGSALKTILSKRTGIIV